MSASKECQIEISDEELNEFLENEESGMESGDSGCSPSTTQRMLTLKRYPTTMEDSGPTSSGSGKWARKAPSTSKDTSSGKKRKGSLPASSSSKEPTGKEEEELPNKPEITAAKADQTGESMGESVFFSEDDATWPFNDEAAGWMEAWKVEMDRKKALGCDEQMPELEEVINSEEEWYCGNCNCNHCNDLRKFSHLISQPPIDDATGM